MKGMEVRIKDRDGHVVNVDEYHDSISTISEIHSIIHKGRFFGTNHFDGAISNNGTIEFLIIPGSKACHIRINASAGGTATLRVFEGVTTSANGTALAITNRNRYSAITAETDVYEGPTVTGDGTSIYSSLLTGGDGPHSTSSESGFFEEYILRDDKQYLVRLTNLAGNNQPLSLTLNFYED